MLSVHNLEQSLQNVQQNADALVKGNVHKRNCAQLLQLDFASRILEPLTPTTYSMPKDVVSQRPRWACAAGCSYAGPLQRSFLLIHIIALSEVLLVPLNQPLACRTCNSRMCTPPLCHLAPNTQSPSDDSSLVGLQIKPLL